MYQTSSRHLNLVPQGQQYVNTALWRHIWGPGRSREGSVGGEDVKGTSNPDWQICAVDKNVVVKLLLIQTDINVNLEDDQGSTALHWKSARSCTRWTGRKAVLTALKK